MKIPISPATTPPQKVRCAKWYINLSREGKDEVDALHRRIRALERGISLHQNNHRTSFTRMIVMKDGMHDNPFPIDGQLLPIEASFVPDQSMVYVYPVPGEERDTHVELRLDNSFSKRCEVTLALRGDVTIHVRGDRAVVVKPESGNSVRISSVPWA